MMDRELLEAAAKAAGIGWDCDSEVWYGEPFVRNDWNPLTDDGDALRLAVALSISVDIELGSGVVFARWYDNGSMSVMEGEQSPAATRRAIVRAAAAMCPEQAA